MVSQKKFLAVLLSIVIAMAPMILPIFVSADDSTVVQTWDFKNLKNVDYAERVDASCPKIPRQTSEDGKILIGAPDNYNITSLKIQDGVVNMSRTAKYVFSEPNWRPVLLQLKLDNTLKAGEAYTLNTDFTVENTGEWATDFYFFYTKSTGWEDGEAHVAPNAAGTVVIDSKAGGFSKYEYIYSFIPSSDLEAGGYLALRFNTHNAQFNASVSSASITKSASKPAEDDAAVNWDFKQFDNQKIVYSGNGEGYGKLTSKDGKIQIGTGDGGYSKENITITDGNVEMEAKDQYKLSHWRSFFLSLKLEKTLKAGETYIFSSDFSVQSTGGWPSYFYFYYSPIGFNWGDGADKAPNESGAVIFDRIEKGFESINSYTYSFTPETDLAPGYLVLKFDEYDATFKANFSKVSLSKAEKESLIHTYWDFSKMNDGNYTGQKPELISSDGNIILGVKNAYWNGLGDWTVKNGTVTQTNNAHASHYVQYVLSLKLSKSLKAGEEYNFVSDLTVNNTGDQWPHDLNFYYTPQIDNYEDNNTNPYDKENAVIIKAKEEGFAGFSGFSASFIPDKDLAPGYLTLRVCLNSSTDVTTVSNAYLLKNDMSVNNRVINGDFENNLIIWGNENSQFSINADSHTGTASVYSGKGYYSKLSQTMPVKANTNYAFEFWYKGEFTGEAPVWAISKGNTFAGDSVINRGSLETSTDWSKKRVVVSSGDNEALNVCFQSVPGAEYKIDDITFEETDEAAEAFEAEAVSATVGDPAGGSFYSSTFYIAKDGTNLLENGGFEEDATGASNDALIISGSNLSVVTDDELVFDGNRSIKMIAGDREENYAIPFSVEPNKEYYVSFFIKCDPKSGWYKDLEKFSPLTYGITDFSTGKFLKGNDNTELKENMQFMLPAYNNRWYMASFSLKSNDSTKLNLVIRMHNSTAYLDNVYIFTKENAVVYEAPLKKLGNIKVTDENPENLDTDVNLIENFNFSEQDVTFWSSPRNSLYGDTLDITDTKHTIQGNAFHYKSNKRYPNRTYYIKWIDVKPNTEYTFSAKYLIAKTGEGFFGVIDGYKSDLYSITENLVYPKFVKKFSFDTDSYDVNQNWQNVGVSFNTGDRNRIGIVVHDRGGEAYIDDVRLFESTNGKRLVEITDNFPKVLEPKSSDLTVKSGKIYGVSPKTTLSKVINSFKNSNYIRAFAADGTEITDLTSLAVTGVELRLMNGPQITARATLVIKGDINGDGLADDDDSAILIKYLTNETDIKGDSYLDAADFNSDGNINVYDAIHISAVPSLGQCEAQITGPAEFAPGQEIYIKIRLNESNVSAVSGKLRFKSGMLEFVSAEPGSAGWIISMVKSSTDVYFAGFGKSGLNNGEFITLKFRVGNISEYADAAVTLTELFAANSASLLSAPQYTWDNTVKLIPVKDEDSYTTITDIIKETHTAENRLSVLSLKEAEISPEFDPEVKDYTATVPYSVKKVTVTAVAANENATVEIGDTELEYVGKNIVSVKVYSPEGIKRTYKITVKRLAPDKKTQAPTGMPLWITLLIILGFVVLACAVVFVVVLLVKHRRNKNNITV